MEGHVVPVEDQNIQKKNKEALIRRRVSFKTHLVEGYVVRLPVRYVPRSVIGKGAYGVVFEALDRETMKSIAIKHMAKAMGRRSTIKRALREVLLMQRVHHEHECCMLTSLCCRLFGFTMYCQEKIHATAA